MMLVNEAPQPGGIPGAVFAYRFDQHGRSFEFGSDEAVGLEKPDMGFIWVHLNLADQRAQAWLKDAHALPLDARLSLLATDTHQTLAYRDEAIWGVIVDVMRDFDTMTDSMAHLRFVMGEHFLVSGRRHALQSIESTRASLASGRMLPGPAALLETLVEHATDGLAKLVSDMVEEVDGIEDRVLDNHFHMERTKLGPLRRREVAIHRQLSGMLSIFRQLALSLERSPREDLHHAVVRLIQRIEALHHEVHSIMGRTRLLQEEIAALMTNETNDHLYVLTVLTTILLPPTLVTGLFGMNTGGLPFKETDWGTLIAVGLCVLSSALVFFILRIMQRRAAL